MTSRLNFDYTEIPPNVDAHLDKYAIVDLPLVVIPRDLYDRIQSQLVTGSERAGVRAENIGGQSMTTKHDTTPDLPVAPFSSAAAWEAWLADEHAQQDGIWLQFAKKKSGIPSVTYNEAVEAALCYGWIDSQKKGYNDTYWLQKFTPRRPNSKWSQSNLERVERLLTEERMQPAGLREVELAQANGQWDAAYAGQAAATVPPDLKSALDAHPQAAAIFATLKSVNRYAILHRLETAKKPETRQKRLQHYIDMLERGETIYPQ